VVKTALDLKRTIKAFVNAAKDEIEVEKVFLTGRHASERSPSDGDIWLLVISPSFEGLSVPERVDKLARIGLRIDSLVQSWGFTPAELSRTLKGDGGSPFLGMMLNQSREVYSNPAASN